MNSAVMVEGAPAESPLSVAVPIPVEERWLRCGGYGTRFLEAGNRFAPPLLLLHDGALGGSSSGSWAAMMPRLAERYWVIAPDMLGYGGSDKAVFLDRSPHSFRIAHLSELLRVLDVTQPVNLVGNSFGGAVGLRSLVAPERTFALRSVVSISGSGGPWRTQVATDELSTWNGTREDLARIQNLLVDDFAGFEDQLTERMRWAGAPGHFKAVQAPTLAVPDPVKARVEDPWPAQLRDVAVPTLLIRCLRDELLELEWADRVCDALPNGRIVDIDDKHSPNIDRPDELEALLLNFLANPVAS
jgi:pimeloyl-ACP methyl ester carboxylesterase